MQDIMTQRAHHSPCDLLLEARALLDEFGLSDEGFQAIGDRLRRAVTRSAWLTEPAISVSNTYGNRILSETIDGSLSLVLSRLSPGSAAPLAERSAWSVACVLQGRVRYVTWKDHAGKGNRRIAKSLELNRGDFVYFPDSPHQRHGLQAIEGHAWELRLIGGAPAWPAERPAYASAA